jgi:D-apionolactonase
MVQAPSLAVTNFGTEEPAPPAPILSAGDFTAEFDAGNLRHIRFGGVEVMRAISFIVRDKNWGTYNPKITNLKIEQSPAGFTVSYDALTTGEGQEFRYNARIDGNASGWLNFRAEGEAQTDFLTNRTGFVVLHPISGVAGHPVTIEHTDGTVVESSFPDLIDPVQPMMNLRALTHIAAPGLKVTCRMEGDTFEMEDQRNWTDASYKTYVRPLALPWPYVLDQGTKILQSVTLTLTGEPLSLRGSVSAIHVDIGEIKGNIPGLGLGFDPAELKATHAAMTELGQIRPTHFICHHDPRQGHNNQTLRESVKIAQALGAKPWLEAVVLEVEHYEQEIKALAAMVQDLGSPFDTIMLSPAPDLKCTLPGSVWPPAPPAEAVFRLARRLFPHAKLAGGMFSFFTEMNRKRPPLAALDMVSFTTSAMVHAGDDVSVVEGLESLPAIAASARQIAGTLPLAVGPSAIGMRMNPYGAAPMDNPHNIRQAMNYNDPRQRGQLGAAWALGYFAHFARSGFAHIAIGSTTGPFGLVHSPQNWPQPFYDQQGGVFPAYHVLRGLSALSAKQQRVTHVSDPRQVQAVAAQTERGTELWLANLTAESQTIMLSKTPQSISRLEADGFIDASQNPRFMDEMQNFNISTLTLAGYGVARLLFN